MYFVNFNNRPKSLIKSYFYDPSNASRDQKFEIDFNLELPKYKVRYVMYVRATFPIDDSHNATRGFINLWFTNMKNGTFDEDPLLLTFVESYSTSTD